LKEYPQAIKLFEYVADHSLSSALTKYSVKEYWLRALLCALAMGVSVYIGESHDCLTWFANRKDPITAKRSISTYSTKDLAFTSTREAKFVDALITAVEAGDTEAFTGAVVEFDSVTKLDNWKTNILLTIKRTIQDEPGLV
jgi:alpha-soluble NSF attachment protein